MKKVNKIILFVLIALMLLTTQVFADSISYHSNGIVKEIILTGQGTAEFYEDGGLKALTVVGKLDLNVYDNNKLQSIVSIGNGTVNYNEDGTLKEVVGELNEILKAAQDSMQEFYTATENYLNKININLNGVANPKDSLEDIYNSLNSIMLNTNNGTVSNSTSNNSSQVNTSGNNISTGVANSGVSVNQGSNDSVNINNSSTQNNSSNAGNTTNGYGAEFYDNGRYEKLVLPEGTITWHENGVLESMLSNKITLYRDERGFNTELSTPSGSITYGDNGQIEEINGSYEIIMNEAEAEYGKLEQAFINYNDYGIISNAGTSENGSNVSVNANQSGVNISTGNNTGVSANQSGVNISAGNNSGVSANQNGVNINLGGFELSAGPNGVNINANADSMANNVKNTIIKYVLLGVAFLVAFVVLIFGIIKIKQKKGQVKIK